MVLVDLAEDRLQSLCSELGKDAIPPATNLLDLSKALRALRPLSSKRPAILHIFHAKRGRRCRRPGCRG